MDAKEGIVIVNLKDEQVGIESREKCHAGDGILHRAVTVLIFNDKDQILITQRSKLKKLWPLTWEASCSTHPYPYETYEQAGKRRLEQELGFSCKLEFISKFIYQAKYKNIGSENEVCALLVGKSNKPIALNSREIASYKWIEFQVLMRAINKNPGKYAPWLKIALKKFLDSKRETKVTKDCYFRKMEETTIPVRNYLIDFIKKGFDKVEEGDFLFFFKKRMKGLWSRPFVVRMGYELGGSDWKRTIPLGVVLELENISTYQSNAVFDNKYGLTEGIPKIKQIIISFLTRNLVQKFIDEICSKNYGNEFASKISRAIYEIDVCNYVGQYIEFNKLHIKNFKEYNSFNDYFQNYSKRCYLYGATWIKNCISLGYQLSGSKDNKTLEILEKFAGYLGTGWMILNDITDYYINARNYGMTYKTSSDELKDVWNGRITLPVYYALNNCSDWERKFLLDVLNNRVHKNNKNAKKVFDILLKSRSFDFSYSVVNFFRKKAKSIIKKLPKNKRKYISIFADAIKSNKFIHEYRKYGLKVIKLPKEIVSILESIFK